MTFVTTIGKTVFCPHLQIEVALTGKCRISGDANDARLMYVSCSVVENSHLPIYEQEDHLKYFVCHQSDNCELIHKFKEEINLGKYGKKF